MLEAMVFFASGERGSMPLKNMEMLLETGCRILGFDGNLNSGLLSIWTSVDEGIEGCVLKRRT